MHTHRSDQTNGPRSLSTELYGTVLYCIVLQPTCCTHLAFQILQVAVAAEFKRPVSVHCVKGYGHLLDFFSGLDKSPDSCPPRYACWTDLVRAAFV